MARASLIFTDYELELIRRRLSGDKTDKTGQFSSRVRPKLCEIVAWYRKPIKLRQLKKLLGGDFEKH